MLTPPQVNNTNGGKVIKPEIKWIEVEDEASLENSQALNAIFNGVNKYIVRLINTCVSAKEAWDILIVAHEGNV